MDARQNNQLVAVNHQSVSEREKEEVKNLLAKYHENQLKINKILQAKKTLNQEQEFIKEKVKSFMKKNELNNICVISGGKVSYNKEQIKEPINKKFFENKILTKLGESNGKQFIDNLYSSRETIEREKILIKIPKQGQLYV
jgi:hypothetical protein